MSNVGQNQFQNSSSQNPFQNSMMQSQASTSPHTQSQNPLPQGRPSNLFGSVMSQSGNITLLTLDSSKFLNSGIVWKRGMFKRYNNKYHMIVEDTFLRYGKIAKQKIHTIDLKEGVTVIADSKNNKGFKVKSSRKYLHLRCDNQLDRDNWVRILNEITERYKDNNQNNSSPKENNMFVQTPQTSQKLPSARKSEGPRTYTLMEISEILKDRNSDLNRAMETNEKVFIEFEKEIKILQNEQDVRRQKERIDHIIQASKQIKKAQGHLFEIISKTNKRLYEIAEQIAVKQIQQDPMEFIRKESVMLQPGELKFGRDKSMKNDEFHSFEDESQLQTSSKINAKMEGKTKVFEMNQNQLQLQEELKQRNSDPNDEVVVTEGLDDVFHDANDFFPSESVLVTGGAQRMTYRQSTKIQGGQNGNLNLEESKEFEEDDPPERNVLPYFKDPKTKISIWTILKDSLGKDISKLSVPVYFNDPQNILQKCATSQEYTDILETALQQKEFIRRLAYVGVYSTTLLANIERNSTKPFNPLLGETFEFVNDKIQFVAEQVSHHPPVTAFHCEGKAGYKIWSNNKAKSKFTGKSLNFIQQCRIYVELTAYKEIYEIQQPVISAHNLILGTPYVDIGGKSIIRCINKEHEQEYVELEYHKRGWSASSAFKIDGDVYSSKKEIPYRIEGKWSEKLYLINNKTGQKDCVWTKNPYPENWEYMYGLTQFGLQMNYFPNFMHKVVPPTDTRRRPDQRALENGDMKNASSEKNRLEEKQRAVRRYQEKNNILHKPVYFEEKFNPEDNQMYFVYNYTYFEKDRKDKTWNRLPDLYSEQLPPEVEQFEKSRATK